MKHKSDENKVPDHTNSKRSQRWEYIMDKIGEGICLLFIIIIFIFIYLFLLLFFFFAFWGVKDQFVNCEFKE